MRAKALTWKFPNSQFSLFADDTLNQWIGPDPRPSESEIVQIEADYAVVAADVEANSEIKNSFESSRVRRLIFEVEFDQENRLRVLEGKTTITKAQYKNALKTLLKTL